MKTINQIIRLLFLSLTLIVSPLLAQQSQSTMATDQKTHFGTSNGYQIGTSDNPVTVFEYCNFLNDKASGYSYVFPSKYFDGSFMYAQWNAGFIEDVPPNVHTAIYRSTWYAMDNSGWYYRYDVAPGCNHDIIDAVYYESIQTEFNKWRSSER